MGNEKKINQESFKLELLLWCINKFLFYLFVDFLVQTKEGKKEVKKAKKKNDEIA